MIYAILLMFSICLGVTGQLFLKNGMLARGVIKLSLNNKMFKTIISMYLNKFVISGVLFFGMSVIFWIAVISKLDLSYAYPLVATNYILVAFFSKIFFKEKVSRLRWLSIFIIAVGVSLVAIS